MYDHQATSSDNGIDPKNQREEIFGASKSGKKPDVSNNNYCRGAPPLQTIQSSILRRQKLKKFVFTDPVAFKYFLPCYFSES